MFDAFVREIEQRCGMNTSDAQGLSSSLLAIVFDPRRGGIRGLAARFHRHGLGALFGSWLGGAAPAQRVEPRQIERVLGANALRDIAVRLSVSENAVAAAAGVILPQLIGAFTPDGQMPSGVPDSIKGYLVGLPGFVELSSTDGELGTAPRTRRASLRRRTRVGAEPRRDTARR